MSTLSADTLNRFVTAFADRIADRAVGCDSDSARLRSARPADHVLAGFLTSPEELDEVGDAELSDLPKDTPYEQTSIGLDWLCDVSNVEAGHEIDVMASGNVYVRLLPTFEEAGLGAVWQKRRDVPTDGATTSLGRRTEPAPVWARVPLPPLLWRIPLPELVAKRRLRFDHRDALESWWLQASATIAHRFPGRQRIWLEEADLSSEDVYDRWRTRLTSAPTARCHWSADFVAMAMPSPDRPGEMRLTVRLRNRSPGVAPKSLDFLDANLYAAKLTCRVAAKTHVHDQLRELRDSFRYDRRLAAVGLNAHATSTLGEGVIELATETVPRQSTFRLLPRALPGSTPTFTDLAGDYTTILTDIGSAMRSYNDDAWSKKVARLVGAERAEADLARETYLAEIAAFEQGVELLSDHRYPKVRRAFQLMNRTMSRVSVRYDEWRLFQIVFIVSQLRALSARFYPELRQDSDEDVEILWFAAGGGKTEAFLGLLLFACFLDRLEGKHWGVTAMLRFPLRLLTFQQMQRVARALAQAEIVRCEAGLEGSRFSIGYFVGAGVTPNRIDEDQNTAWTANGPPQEYQRLFACPFCGARVQIRYQSAARQLQHYCLSDVCSGGPGALPLYIVDNDIYRYLPTLLISTVDKLALFGQNQRFANLFGRVTAFCTQHGADFVGSNKDVCPGAEALARAGDASQTTCAGTLLSGPFPHAAPALLIQDELHLLSEELGTFDAHYETAVMELTRTLDQRPWKIIAATATIEAFRHHAWSLYLRAARQFPGPGPQAYESFYYHADLTRLGRVFMGLVGIGRKHTPSVTRALSLVYQELDSAKSLAETNPVEANRRYGLTDVSASEFRDLLFLYELPLTYVLTRKGSDQVSEAIETRVKAELREFAPGHGELHIETFNGGVAIGDMIRTLEEVVSATASSDAASRVRGIVTTNIIGHGVDVDRFNMMVFAGFTRHVAEYIQAAARVGRTYPGIVVFVATPQSERDRSIYSRFGKFHEYVDRLVDPSALSRWPEPAIRRTAPGILAGHLMGAVAWRLKRSIWSVEDVQAAFVGSSTVSVETINEWMQRAYGTEHASQRVRDQLSVTTANLFASIVNMVSTPGSQKRLLSRHLDSMTSLRDVDEPASIVVFDEKEKAAVRRITRV